MSTRPRRRRAERTRLDEFSVPSHERAAAAQDNGRFDAQSLPITLLLSGLAPV